MNKLGALALVLLACSCSSAKSLRSCTTPNGACIDFDVGVTSVLSDDSASGVCSSAGATLGTAGGGCYENASRYGYQVVGSCALGTMDIAYFDYFTGGESGARADCAARGGAFVL